MPLPRWILAAAACLTVLGTLACSGLGGALTMDPEVASDLDSIQPSRVGADAGGAPGLIELEGAGPPPGESGSGLQVVQVAPIGPGRKALQVAVVFDRPMIALTQLDHMVESVPVSCAAEGAAVPVKARWAGTSTAVLLPDTDDKAFPLATAFTCTVPAGTTSVDGTALENEIRWGFETPRPRVVGSTPRDRASNVRPDAELSVRFDQPVQAGVVAALVELRDERGAKLTLQATDDPDDPRLVRLQPRGMAPDTGYVLRLREGVRGVAGPLPSTTSLEVAFRTYPPLALKESSPSGSVSPIVPLRLEFTTPVEPAKVSELLTLDPAPVDEWSPPNGTWTSTRWTYHLKLLPRTRYTATLAPGLVDTYGQTLGGATWTFETGDYPPWVHVSTGLKIFAANNPHELPLRHLNVRTLDAELVGVPASRVPEIFDQWRFSDLGRGGAVHRVAVDTDDVPNRIELDALDLGPHLESERGLVAYTLSSPEVRAGERPRTFEGAVLITDLGATLKVSPGAVEAWVTRLSTGRPAAGVEVDFYQGKRKLGTATADASGLARFEGAPAAGWQQWGASDRIRVVARDGADWTLVEQGWSDGIESYRFGIWGGFDADGRQATSHGFADRGVYRPGDPAYARVTFRVQSAAGLEVPAGADVQWTFSDPDGARLSEGEGQLDARGGVNVEVQLPEEGRLGDYRVHVTARGEGWNAAEYVSLPSRAYRAPAFRVKVDGPDVRIAGDELTASVDARYLFGAPLSTGEVTWRSWSESRWFRPDGFDGFSFGPEYRWWEDDERLDASVHETHRAEVEAGRHVHTRTIPVDAMQRPQTWHVEAEVVDADRQAVANRAEVLVHPAAWYVGLRPEARLPVVGRPTHVEIVGVTPDGQVHTGEEVTVQVVRRTWDRVREKGMDGRWSWVNTPVDHEELAEAVRLGREPVRVAFTPEKTGQYLIKAESRDDRGNTVRASDTVYVVGSGRASWALSDDPVLELVPDKKRYHPGDTARILVKSPRPDLHALVTVEREGVLSREVVQLDSTASVVEVPIKGAYLPNVFVSVVAVTGAPPQDSPDKGRPDVRVGMVDLEVDPDGERLEVSLASDREVYRPREQVTVQVDVKRGGQPVPGAGITLYAVDESVLSLTGYRTPEAHDAFYRSRGLSTLTADSRVRVLDRAQYLTKGAPRGGGGGDEELDGPEVRERFLTTIAWAPDLRAGPDGTVSHTFELPDNLTTFRIMAVADSGATSFGSADREIRVTRPIIARPALPRFLRSGDTAFAGLVVHNNTDATRSIEVAADVEGPVRLTGAPVTVSVPAHGAVEVPFRLRAFDPGDATFELTISSGSEQDAVRWTIPVRRDITFETVASTGSTTSSATERIARPDDALREHGGLTVDLASTVLVGAGAGLEYLVDYPHGCVEQITSRAMGSLYALQIRDAASIEVAEATLRGHVEGVLRDLAEYDHPSGGLTYWRGSRRARPSVAGTAYAVELMGRAKEAGFSVDEAQLKRRVDFLRDVANGKHVDASDPLLALSTRAYVAVALARAGHGDAGHHNRLFAQRQDLSVLAQASLLEAIARTTGPDARTVELERAILGRATVEAAAASIKENGSGRWARLWGSDDLSTAAALEALLVAKGTHPMAERFAKHLASARKYGRWHNTRATAGVLAALARYAAVYEEAGAPIDAEVKLAGRSLLARALSVPDSASVQLAMSDVDNGELSVTTGGGRLYYEARLRYAPTVIEARDEGFTLRRTMEIVDGGSEDGGVTSGALIEVTLQVVTPVGRHAVAIVDPLPAGLEPVESSFATSSQAPRDRDEGAEHDELPRWAGSWVFDHHELRDDQVRLYADRMPPGIHTWRYVVRATTPGTYEHPAATVEEMYEPENFGRTRAGTLTVGRASGR